MVKPPLTELSYLFIREKFGFKPNVYHDKYGIPCIGTGIKFFTHNRITRKFRLKSKIGTVSRQEFIKILFNTNNSNNTYVKGFEKSLQKEGAVLNKGLKVNVHYYDVNLSENDYLKNIWHGKINLYGSILQETQEKVSLKIWDKLSLIQKATIISFHYCDIFSPDIIESITSYAIIKDTNDEDDW